MDIHGKTSALETIRRPLAAVEKLPQRDVDQRTGPERSGRGQRGSGKCANPLGCRYGRCFGKAVAANDGAGLASLFTEDGVYDDGFFGEYKGRTAIAGMLAHFHETGSNFRWDFFDALGNGDAGYARYRFSYASAMPGAQGKPVVFEGIGFFQFRNGLPGYDVRYVERPVVADGSGDEVAVDGSAVLLIRMEPALDAEEVEVVAACERLDELEEVRVTTVPSSNGAAGER